MRNEEISTTIMKPLVWDSRTSTLQRSYPYVHFIEDLRKSQEVVDAKPVETEEIEKGDPKGEK